METWKIYIGQTYSAQDGEEMNTQNDPEQTQLAPTETFITPPTEPAPENQPTVISPHGPREEPLPYWPYVPEPPPAPATPPQEQGQPGQEAKQAHEIPWQQASLGVGGGGLLFTMNATTISVSKEVMIVFLLLAALLIALWIYCHYAFKGAPEIA